MGPALGAWSVTRLAQHVGTFSLTQKLVLLEGSHVEAQVLSQNPQKCSHELLLSFSAFRTAWLHLKLTQPFTIIRWSRVARCCLDIWVRVYMVLLALYLLFLKTKVLYKCTHIQNLQKCMHALYPRFLMGSFPFDEGIPFLTPLLLLPSSSKGLQQWCGP